MANIELVIEHNTPVAAIIPERMAAEQLNVVYAIVRGLNRQDCFNQPELANRWNVSLVITTDDWAAEQLRRKPMLRPKGHSLAFGSSPVIAPKNEALTDIDAAFKIIRLVSKRFKVSLKDLESDKRPWCIAWPRFYAMVLIRDNTRLPLEKISLLFNRDHGCVVHAVRAVADRIATDRADAALFSELQEQTAAALGRPLPSIAA